MKFGKLASLIAAVLAFAGAHSECDAVEKHDNAIVNHVSNFGGTIEIASLVEALDELTQTNRMAYSTLRDLADHNFSADIDYANQIRDELIFSNGLLNGVLALMPAPEQLERSSDVFTCFVAVKKAAQSASSLFHLVEQIVFSNDSLESTIDIEALKHLLNTGNAAASRIH